MTEQIISGIAALIKETGYRMEYVVWEMPCAWLFLLLDFWPYYEKDKSEDEKDVSEIPNLSELGLGYGKN